MPVKPGSLIPRWQNGTSNIHPTPGVTPSPTADAKAATITPSTIPEPVYETVSVVPAYQIAAVTHAPVSTYQQGGGASILTGYCSEPAYTILDGPTALWVPVVGCISSKADCCPTRTSGSGANPTGANNPEGNDSGSGAEFPISSLPVQGTITGCPKDYHTVGKTACCPSSYWLWATGIGGQVPCYSSLQSELDPPPMPDTLADGPSLTGSVTKTGSKVPALTIDEKPTSAIVNIVFAMQYPMVPAEESTLGKAQKIGIGVGVSGAAIVFGFLIWIVVRTLRMSKKRPHDPEPVNVSQRFDATVDTSRAPLRPAYGEVKPAGVASRAVHF